MDQRENLHKELDVFLDRVENETPNVEDGEIGIFKLEGGQLGEHEGKPLFDFSLTVSFCRSCL
jgi:hypothetical protein